MNADRLRKAIGLAIIIVGCAISARFLVMAFTARANTSDFTVLWAAGRIDPGSVYDYGAVTAAQRPITGLSGDQLRPFVYPPSSLLVFRPISLLPFEVAYLCWIAMLAGVFALAARRSFGRPAVVLAMITPPLVYGVWGGQPSILGAAIILASVPQLPKRPVLAGIILGIGAAIKPQCFVLVPLALLILRNWKACSGFAAGALVPVAISALLWPTLWSDWIGAVAGFPIVIRGLGLDGSGISPAAIAPAFGLSSEIGWIIQAVGTLLGLALVWLTWTRFEDPAARATGLIGGTILVSPYAMPYELAGLVPAAVSALLAGRLVLGVNIIPPLAKLSLPIAAILAIRRPKKWMPDEDSNLD